MIYTSEEYCKHFTIGGKKVSPRTVKRCCEKGLLPSGHIATKLSSGWVIEVANEAAQIYKIDTNSAKNDPRILSRKFFNFK